MERGMAVFYFKDLEIKVSLAEIMQSKGFPFIAEEILPTSKGVFCPIRQETFGYVVEPGNGEWSVLWNEMQIDCSHILKHGDYIKIFGENNYGILILDHRNQSVHLRRMHTPKQGNIFLGRGKDADILININNMVSRKHAAIHIEGGKARIEDLSRKSGVYRNGKRVISEMITAGDTISIMGQEIIYMPSCLLIPEYLPCGEKLKEIKERRFSEKGKSSSLIEYTRTPRILKTLSQETICIDAPPSPNIENTIPFLLSAGPSLTMAVAMIGSLCVTFLGLQTDSGNRTSVITGGIMAVSMLLGAIFWPFLLRRYHKKQSEKREKYRVDKYTKYLEEKEEEILKAQERNKRIWSSVYYPEPEVLLRYAEDLERHLWEKMKEDSDFLNIRVGIGEKEFESKIQVPQKKFSMFDDPLLEQAVNLESEYKMLKQVPIAIAVKEQIIGLVGLRAKIDALIRAMIISISVQYAPDEVKMIFILGQEHYEEYSWVMGLPHIWNFGKTIRFVAEDKQEMQTIFHYLEEYIGMQKEQWKEGGNKKSAEQFIVFILEEHFIKDVPIQKFHDYMKEMGFSFIFASERFAVLPKECEILIQADQTLTGVYVKNENKNKFIHCQFDCCSREDGIRLTKAFSKIAVGKEEIREMIPAYMTFMDMYHAGNVEELNITKRWKNSRASKSLAVPIGSKGSELFYLDIHEKYHGSHGLVAGMTGSGKSEFLQTYILSLMVNYSPSVVNFLLIDFKGGDMARPFLKAPHLAATISNLAKDMLYRAKVSIDAEIRRRQMLLNETASVLHVDKMDINTYMKYYEEKKITRTLPHLLIIIDEFAQLKTQHQEFMEYLINVAQVGRSLGIHLILATQKPSGVVDAQIWSNSKFRVCLKVLDKQDSMEMIGRGDAARIKSPGRAYVQVGYDEVFEQIQSGYSGADYYEWEHYTSEDTITVELLDHTATIENLKKDLSHMKKVGSIQLEMIMKKIESSARSMEMKAKPLWEKPLKTKVFLFDNENNIIFRPKMWEKERMEMIQCGICDLPRQQKQIPYKIPLIGRNNMVVYGMPGSGKTTFLQTILFAYALGYSPEMLNIYVLDFGGRGLGIVNEMPHCVAQAFADEEEKAATILRRILAVIEKRKILFAKAGCNTFESYQKTGGKKVPIILFVLDNYAGFRERLYRLEDEVIQIAANGTTYGVYTTITGNSKNAIFYKLLEYIPERIVLKMNDDAAYRDLLGCPVPFPLEEIKGRGYTVIDKEAVQIQLALPFETEIESVMYETIRNIYREMNQYWNGKKEERIEEGSEEIQKNMKLEYPCWKNASEEMFVIGNALYDGRKQGIDWNECSAFFAGTRNDEQMKLIYRWVKTRCIGEIFFYGVEGDEADKNKQIIGETGICQMITMMEKKFAEKDRTDPVIIYINGFADFYNQIRDEDLERLQELLRRPNWNGIRFFTVEIFEKLRDYRDTELYIRLIQCCQGLVMGGNIDSSIIYYLPRDFNRADVKDRQKKLNGNQAILYRGTSLSMITLEEAM